MKKILMFASLAAAGVLAGCGGGGSDFIGSGTVNNPYVGSYSGTYVTTDQSTGNQSDNGTATLVVNSDNTASGAFTTQTETGQSGTFTGAVNTAGQISGTITTTATGNQTAQTATVTGTFAKSTTQSGVYIATITEKFQNGGTYQATITLTPSST